MKALKSPEQVSAAAALKAERERDKAQALRDYEDEQRALRANMARLRDLRLAKERAAAKTPAPRRAARKKAPAGSAPRAAS